MARLTQSDALRRLIVKRPAITTAEVLAGPLRGRVISIYGMIFRAAPAAGALVIGALSEHFGWHWPLAVSCVLCLAVWLWARSRRNRMRAALET